MEIRLVFVCTQINISGDIDKTRIYFNILKLNLSETPSLSARQPNELWQGETGLIDFKTQIEQSDQ